MADIKENIYRSIEIITEGILDKAKFDKTITANIKSIVDPSTGEYEVLYQDAIFKAYANDLSKLFKVGDTVLVKIPEGDMSGTKTIEGLSTRVFAETDRNILDRYTYPVGGSFDTIFSYSKTPSNGLIAGGEEESSIVIYDEEASAEEIALFKTLADKYSLIKISAEFMTAFRGSHTKGNYGLRVYFKDNNDEDLVFTFDITSFIGSIYNYPQYSPQEVFISTKAKSLKYLRGIEFFQEGFEYDTYRDFIDNEWKDVQNTTIPNLFVRNVTLQYYDNLELSDSDYTLLLLTPNGKVFGGTDLPIEGKLFYGGENLISNATCKWYLEDSSVQIGSEDYEKDAGPGWKAVSGELYEGQGMPQLVIKSGNEDIVYKRKYKLLVVYNKNVFSQVIEIEKAKEAEETYNFTIEQRAQGKEIELYISDSEYSGNWYIFKDGSYQKINAGAFENSINVTEYLKYDNATFKVDIYNNDSKPKFLCSLEKTFFAPAAQDDITVNFSGTELYKYDANGDISILEYDVDRILQGDVRFKDGYFTEYTVKWYTESGGEISSTPVSPSGSMLEGVFTDAENVVHYKIAKKFNRERNKNALILKISTIEGKEYEFKKSLLFLKDGDPGTNGTTFSCIVYPVTLGESPSRLEGDFYPLFVGNTTARFFSNWQYQGYVYYNGERITTGSSPYKVSSYKWSSSGVKLTQASGSRTGQIVEAMSTDLENFKNAYVSLEVTVTDGTNTQTLHYNYPIPIVLDGTITSDEDAEIERRTYEVNIPTYTQYSTSGYNPSFKDLPLSAKKGEDTYNSFESGDTTILQITNQHLIPATSFISPDCTYVLVKETGLPEIYYTVMMYLNTYGNEALNSWDGTSLKTENGYVLAPQIGAGKKETNNTFTGVVMGKDTAQDKVGLYGYQSGVSTFGFMEDGKAYIGKAGNGRIQMDGSNALIYGGMSEGGANSMLLRLHKGTKTDNAIEIKGDNSDLTFFVNYKGEFTATKATITGNITAESGKIGGWTIGASTLTGGNTVFNSDGSINANNVFTVGTDGKITATGGTIGGWNIQSGRLYSGDVNLYSSDQSTKTTIAGNSTNMWRYTAGTNFGVTKSGYLYASGVTISGDITASSGSFSGKVYASEGTFANGTFTNATVTGTLTAGSYLGGSTKVYESGGLISSDGTTYVQVYSGYDYLKANDIYLRCQRLHVFNTSGTDYTGLSQTISVYSSSGTRNLSFIHGVYVGSSSLNEEGKTESVSVANAEGSDFITLYFTNGILRSVALNQEEKEQIEQDDKTQNTN